MTLEKLLIFGFALAALLAITTIGTNMFTAREATSGDFNKGLGDIEGVNF